MDGPTKRLQQRVFGRGALLVCFALSRQRNHSTRYLGAPFASSQRRDSDRLGSSFSRVSVVFHIHSCCLLPTGFRPARHPRNPKCDTNTCRRRAPYSCLASVPRLHTTGNTHSPRLLPRNEILLSRAVNFVRGEWFVDPVRYSGADWLIWGSCSVHFSPPLPQHRSPKRSIALEFIDQNSRICLKR